MCELRTEVGVPWNLASSPRFPTGEACFPTVGELVLVYGIHSPDGHGGRWEVGVDKLVDLGSGTADWNSFDVVTHWAYLEEVPTP